MMRVLMLGALAAAVAVGALGCGSSPQGEGGSEPAALVATGNERLVSLNLPGMT
jgi:hypothetical protein